MVRTKRSGEGVQIGRARRQPDRGHARGREEIGGRQHVPVGGQELPPGRPFRPVGGGLQPMAPEHVGDGAASYVMTQIRECTTDPRIAPVPILGGHLNDQLPDLLHHRRTTGPAAMAAVVFARDEVTMPGEQGVGGDQCLHLTKRATTEGLGLRGQATPLDVGEAEPAGGELFAQHPVLCLEIVDDVALLLVDPAGHGDDEELQRVGKRAHGGRA